jgi:F420-non-reducing hydrogenase iron-sulfur subunit
MTKNQNDDSRRIIAFGCDKWGYSVADLTGVTRKSYSTDFHLIRVRCTGRIGIHLIMEAFLNGADGVAIISWKEGECEFGNGNTNTYQHVITLKKILKHEGISEERIQQYFCSAAEVEKFMTSVEDISSRIQALPPLPKNNPN